MLRHPGLVARQSLPQLKCNPPELRNDLFDILNMDAGPSAVLRVCRNRPCLALRGPWSGASPAVQPTPGLSVEGRLLAGRPLTSFGAAAFTRPVGTKTRYDARFEESWVVKFCRYSFSPFRGRAPVGFDKALPEGLNPAPWSGRAMALGFIAQGPRDTPHRPPAGRPRARFDKRPYRGWLDAEVYVLWH